MARVVASLAIAAGRQRLVRAIRPHVRAVHPLLLTLLLRVLRCVAPCHAARVRGWSGL